MTNAIETQPGKIATHHCRECGEQVEETGFCAAHPNEIVDTILSVHKLRAAVTQCEADLQIARDSLDAEEANADLCGVELPSDNAWGYRVSECEDLLRAAQLALINSDCPRTFELFEGGYRYDTMLARSVDEALERARENAVRDSYDDCKGTLWIDVRVSCEETGESDSGTVTLDEDEPKCESDAGHDWQSPHALVGGLKENPGVHGHGGGVIITEVCLHCGCKRTTDTWAQNPETGEQGLTSVTHEEEAFTTEELNAAVF